MVNIKNYYIQLKELEIATIRLETLEEQLKLLDNQITSSTSSIKEVVSSGGIVNDKMTQYVIDKENTLNKIEYQKMYIDLLHISLKKMENVLRQISDIEEKVFTLTYIDGCKPKDIAKKIPCDISTVYRKLDKINERMQTCEKMQKIL